MATGPQIPSHHPPMKVRSFAAGELSGGDIDLEAESGMPAFPPQQVLLHATAAESARLTMVDGETVDVVLAAGETRSIEGAIAGTVAAGSGASVSMIAYWRHMGSPDLNP